MESSTLRPRVVITMIAAAILALLASCGVYSAASPGALTGKQAEFHYGSK
ncbi:MAG TPA: hypothetical protein PLA46_14240 [Phycicoccus sp.]|jgi:hypothetical protein|nr:hypothetical protein [Phycicoccus sp.]HQY95673.1 hypothetical protein [Phycicoccus sp.]HRA44493.1 hypothetical protein [Phycicoccus sp.]